MNIPSVSVEKAAELAIAQAERRFREVFESSPAGVARVGLDGTWLEINDRFRDMLGYTLMDRFPHRTRSARPHENSQQRRGGESRHCCISIPAFPIFPQPGRDI